MIFTSLNKIVRIISIFVKENLMGLIVSVVVASIVAGPAIIFHFSDNYRGIDMFAQNTELHYVAEIKEVFDGHRLLGNPFFADLKNTPYLFPLLSPNLAALFGGLFGLNIAATVIVGRFFFVALLAFFIYLFTKSLTGSKYISLVAPAFVILGYNLVAPSFYVNLIKYGFWGGSEPGLIDYGRPINPQISSIFFFAYLFFFYNFLFNEKNKKIWGMLSAVILGLSFYVYLFTWTYIFALNGMIFLMLLFKKETQRAKEIVYISLGALLIGLPYFVNYFSVISNPDYAETAPRFGFVNFRGYDISRLVVFGIILFILFYKKINAKTRWFLTALLVTALITVNEHLITGFFIFNHHYHWYFNTPVVIIVLTLIFYTFLSRFNLSASRIKLITALLISLIVVNGLSIQYFAYQSALSATIQDQRYAIMIKWLDDNTVKDAVVLTSPRISNYVSALTHDNVFYNATAIYTLAPNQRFEDAYLAYRFLDGVKKEGIKDFLISNRNDIGGFVFGYSYVFQPGSCIGCFPDEVINKMAETYSKIDQENFITFLKKYPLDYIVWDQKNDPSWGLERFALDKIAVLGDFIVYRVR